jgi:GT2 family glycosyltransferase
MTQEAVLFAKADVIVLEQNPEVPNYIGGKTVFTVEPFNYNYLANRGVEIAETDWIVISNNDVVFMDGWLEELLKPQYPIVSPKCPNDERQSAILVNTTGYETGVHLSGWCFMIHRDLWKKIGGFDEDFKFWCADNSLMEQLIKVEVPPMIVPAAIVEHLESKTLITVDNQHDLTHEQVRKYNKKYGRELFGMV